MNTLSSALVNADMASVLQAILAILITVGCFASFFLYQTTPEWAVQLLVLVYGFFFGSRYGASQQLRSVKNEP